MGVYLACRLSLEILPVFLNESSCLRFWMNAKTGISRNFMISLINRINDGKRLYIAALSTFYIQADAIPVPASLTKGQRYEDSK